MPDPAPTTPSIDATLQERGRRYGCFSSHAHKSQELKRFFRRLAPGAYDALADDQKEALDMIAHKLARILNGDPDYDDSWHDIAGYAELVAKRLAKPMPKQMSISGVVSNHTIGEDDGSPD